MRTLIVSLTAESDRPVTWAVCEPHAGAPLRVGTTPAGERIALEASVAQTWVIVPGTAVTAHLLALPVRDTRRAAAAATFLLEDELAIDTAAVHIALGSDTGDRRLVAVVDHAAMASWLGRIASLGLAADLLVPDFLALPMGARVCREGLVSVRTPEGGFSAEEALLPWLTDDAVAPPLKPAATPAFLHDIYISLSAGPVLDLRQGRYRPRRDWRAAVRPYRRAGALAASLAVLALAAQGIEGLRFNARAEAVAARAEAVFRTALPEVKRVVNPRAQMRAHLQAAKTGGSEAFLKAAEILVAAAHAVDGVEVQTMRYDGRRRELVGALALPSFEAMEGLKREIAARGAGAQEGSARQDGARVFAEVTVKVP